MERRWKAGTYASVSGVQFRVVEGKKEPGDLRLEWRTSTGWQAVEMAATALMTDFFVENEEHLKQYRSNWTRSGQEYFFDFLKKAVYDGWEAVRDEVRGQREALGTRLTGDVTPPDPSLWCGLRHPNENVVCMLSSDHKGPCRWGAGTEAELVWPKANAA